MATRKRGAGKGRSPARGKPDRSAYKQRAKLKQLGLISKRTDLRKKPTRAQLKAIAKFENVLSGKATVVEVPRGDAKRYKKGFVTVGRKVIVPRQKGERVSVEKSTGRIVARSRGRKRIIHAKGKVPRARKGKRLFYSVPFSNGGTVTFDSLAELREFMAHYDTYKNWREYLEIDEFDDEGEGGE